MRFSLRSSTPLSAAGSPNVFINGKPAARAAGKFSDVIPGATCLSRLTWLSLKAFSLNYGVLRWRPRWQAWCLALPIKSTATDIRRCRSNIWRKAPAGLLSMVSRRRAAVIEHLRGQGRNVEISPNVIIGGAPWWCARFAAARRRVLGWR